MAEAVEQRLTPAKAAWRRLGFCECGNPEDVLSLVGAALRALVAREEYSDAHRSGFGWTENDEVARRLETDVLPLGDANALLMRYVLAAADLTEHGGSVFGCWPSEKGVALLAFLDATPPDEWMDEPDPEF